MAVLLLKFDAPMQSWGIDEKLKDHKTDFIPSKSAVIGMIASAEGRRRDEDVSDLANLRFGVRIDCDGEIMGDYHVSVLDGSFGETKDNYGTGHQASTISSERTKLGTRYYLADAVFVCGIEGEEKQLEKIKESLLYPANALFLGRRSCPVTAELVQEIVPGTLETALKSDSGNKRAFLDIKGTTTDRGHRTVKDAPISFNPMKRVYALRKCMEVRL